jgi:hypothetical protein
MTIAKSVIFDGMIQRQVQAGDVIAGGEVVPATDAGTTKTVTAANLAGGIILRSGGAAMTDTLDSAANIIAGMLAGLGATGFQPGTTFRVRYVVSTAFAVTVQATANTGVTVNRGSVAASSFRDFLVTINNGTPVQTFTAYTTSGSAVVSGLTQAQLQQLTPGMVVTNAVNGLQGTTIQSINYAAGTLTLSNTANATAAVPVAITFSPVITVDGI